MENRLVRHQQEIRKKVEGGAGAGKEPSHMCLKSNAFFFNLQCVKRKVLSEASKGRNREK